MPSLLSSPDRAGDDPVARLRRRLVLRSDRRGDEGFLLLESVMAIALTTLLMAALASFFTTAVASTGSQRTRQAAAQVAGSEMERLRALPAADLVTGRGSASVTAQFAAASPAVQQSLSQMSPTADTSAAPSTGATAAVPTNPTPQVVGPTTYNVSTYLGTCKVNSTVSSVCTTGGTSVEYLRAVVAVTWPGAHCPEPACSYVTSTLISPADDPVFALNQTPPPAPLVHAPGHQVWTAGAPVLLQLAVEEGTGVPTMTWGLKSGVLPTGVSLGSNGLVSGTPTAPGGATSVEVEVTDAFVRKATATFTWRVVPGPTVTAPANQTTTAGDLVDLTPTATCPNGPCTFALTGAPTGLSIAHGSGAITGRPTTPGTYDNVTVMITDAGGASARATFRWVVTYAPLTTPAPGDQKSTVATAIAPLQLNASGGSGGYTWSAVSGLPAGLTLSSAGHITGTPTSTTSGPVTVTVRVTDATAAMTKDLSFAWTVVAQPTIASQASVTTSVGARKSAGIAYTCPYASCTIALTGGVPGAGLSTDPLTSGDNGTGSLTVSATSGTVYLAGTVQPRAVQSGTSATHAPALTITDGAGATATSTGSWQVYAAATVASPGSLGATEGNIRSVSLAYACPYPSCTITLTGDVPGVGLSTSSTTATNNTNRSLTVTSASGTVYLAGTVQDTAVTSGTSAAYSPKVTVTDAGGSSTSATGTWTAYERPTVGSLPARSATIGATKNEAVDYSCFNAPCTITLANKVPGLGLSTTGGVTTANSTGQVTVGSGTGSISVTGQVEPSAVTTGTNKAYVPAVTVTDSSGVTVTTSAAWTAYTAPTIINPGSQAARPTQDVSLQISANCPNGGCKYVAEALPPGSSSWTPLAVDSGGRITESRDVPNGTYSIRVSATDADGISKVESFLLTVQDFTLAIPDQTLSRSPGTGAVTVSDYLSPRVDGYTYSFANTPPNWISISDTGIISTTKPPPSAVNQSFNVSVKVTSKASSGSFITDDFLWMVTK